MKLVFALAVFLTVAVGPVLAAQPHDRLLETLPSGDRSLVLRYLDPQITTQTYGDALVRLDALCASDGRAAWQDLDPRPDELVIVLMDRPVPRGTADPDATQYISAYVIDQNGDCVWQ